jgi:hypothetical protein
VRKLFAAAALAAVLGGIGCSGDTVPTPDEAAQTVPAEPPPADKPPPSDEIKVN